MLIGSARVSKVDCLQVAERDALEALLAGGEAPLNCVDGTPVPALPLIGQLLLGVGLLGGGARQLYRWTSG